MCDACRWNDHDRCAGYLGDGRRLRCLCRGCLLGESPRPVLTVHGPVVLTLVVGSGPEPGLVPDVRRPRLRLVRGGA